MSFHTPKVWVDSSSTIWKQLPPKAVWGPPRCYTTPLGGVLEHRPRKNDLTGSYWYKMRSYPAQISRIQDLKLMIYWKRKSPCHRPSHTLSRRSGTPRLLPCFLCSLPGLCQVYRGAGWKTLISWFHQSVNMFKGRNKIRYRKNTDENHGCNDVIIPMGKTAQHSDTFHSNERSVGRVLAHFSWSSHCRSGGGPVALASRNSCLQCRVIVLLLKCLCVEHPPLKTKQSGGRGSKQAKNRPLLGPFFLEDLP